jgi:hypothetical protein
MTSRTSRATRVPGARHWPLAALLLASVLWGGAITGTKYALRAFDPITLLSVELAAATAALWAVLLIRGYRPPPSWPAAVLLGLLEPALACLGETFGLGGHRPQPHPGVRAAELHGLPRRGADPQRHHRSVPHRRLGDLLHDLP